MLGIDPGLANTGWAVVTHSNDGMRLLAAQVIRTKPSPKKLRLRAGDVRSQRVRLLVRHLQTVITSWQPTVLSIETSGGVPINAKAALDLAAGWGAVLALAECKGLAVLHYTPLDMRTALGMAGSVSKASMWSGVAAALESGSDAVETLPRTYRDHAADAAALAVAAGEHPTVLMMVIADG